MRITIDGVEREIAAEGSLLEALVALGVDVPHLCHDGRLAPVGVCRLCSVELEGVPRHAAACTTRVTEGLVVRTKSPALEAERRTTLELLAARHPDDDGTSDTPLHRYFAEYGVVPSGKRQRAPDETHPYIRVDMSKCIDCLRCIRICHEIQGQDVWNVMDRGEALRIAPDGPTLAKSSCVSCGACVDTCPSGALEDKSLRALGAPDSWTRTTCPYCGTGCEMDVGTRASRIVGVRPVMGSKVSKGHLCVKGRYAFDFVHSADRLTHPMIRKGASWVNASWTEAVDFVATSISRILEAHGPGSVGVLGSARATNEDNYVAQKFARVVLGTNNVDCCARVCHAPTAAAMSGMLGTGAATNSFDDIERAACFLVCGANPTENHPIVGARIRQRVRSGARLIVIDPRRIELSDIADVHLSLRPGSNIPLLHAMAHVIVEEELYDAEFIRARTHGLDELRALLDGFSPDCVETTCGVSAADIRRAARLYATSRPAMAFHGLGVTEHSQGTDGVRCLVNLVLLTGNIGKLGAGLNPLRGQNNVQGAAHMGCEPARLTGYASLERHRELFESVWGCPIPAASGMGLMDMMDAARAGSLHALWAIGYDILLTNPNANVTAEALSRLELLVVQDLFLNETARQFAHVVLPAASSFERDGTFMNSERRVQRVRKAVEPIGEARPDWQIIADVAKAMGNTSAFSFGSAGDIWEEIRRVWPAGAGITYSRLEHGGLQWPCPEEDHPGTEMLHEERFQAGPRTAFAIVPFKPSEETLEPEYPLLLVTGRTLYQFNAGTMTLRTKDRDLRPCDYLVISPEDALRFGLVDGDVATVRSRYGVAKLPVLISNRVRAGELFTTFHTADGFVNRVTGPHRDAVVGTPEYKLTAVRIEH